MSDPALQDVLVRLCEAALDPVVCAGIFRRANGQPPVLDDLVAEWPSPWPQPEQAVQLLWCADPPDVARALPGLWRQVSHHVPEGGGCVDLTVDVDVLGRLVAADIESEPLAGLLAGVGQAAAAAAADELPGLPAEVAVPALADLLERLLMASRAG